MRTCSLYTKLPVNSQCEGRGPDWISQLHTKLETLKKNEYWAGRNEQGETEKEQESKTVQFTVRLDGPQTFFLSSRSKHTLNKKAASADGNNSPSCVVLDRGNMNQRDFDDQWFCNILSCCREI